VNAAVENPFRGLVPEVALPRAPLAKVLAQLRYPKPLDFSGPKSVEPIRKSLASHYPVGRETKAMQVVITNTGVSQQPTGETNWIFEDIQAQWKVTLSEQFVAIETAAYTTRDDFTTRFSEIVHAVAETLHPPVYDRLGIRYINRLEGADVVDDLHRLVKPIALAGLAVPHDDVQIQHSLSDTIFIDGNAHLQVRWGWLPAGATIDPTIEAPRVPYWLLDIDSFTGKGGPFEVSVLDREVRDLAERAHRFFRWVVTDEFLKRFGGQT
jgi:uncharacterized protein (TIGR04255 family)